MGKAYSWGRFPLLLIGIATSVVSWWVYYGFSVWQKSPDPAFIAWALLLSVLIHELCHWVAMETSGVRSSVVVLVLLGGTFPIDSNSAHKLTKKISWSKSITIALAGVLGNAAIIIVANWLAATGNLQAKYAVAITHLNAGMIFFNLLPFWGLDGYRFAKALFNSAPERLDHVYARLMGAVAITGCIVIGIGFHKMFIFYPALMFLRLDREADLDDPHESLSRRAMTRTQEKGWIAIYLTLFLVGVAASLMTPYWTKVL